MNKETQQLIEQLAQKLGTTSEYLWQVLVNQAQISATTTLIQTLLIIIGSILLYRLHVNFLKETNKRDSIYYRYEEAVSIPMGIAAFVMTILIVVAFLCVDDIINGYFNPEYWALNKILNTIK